MDQSIDLAGMEPSKDTHGTEHKTTIENVKESLMRDDVASVALGIFGQTEDGSDQDEKTASIQGEEVTLPRYVFASDSASRGSPQAEVEHASNDTEHAEKENLDDQTDNDDVLAQFVTAGAAAGLDTATSTLTDKGHDITNDKDLGQPLGSDERVLFAIGDEDDATEFHVDRSREEGWGNEEEQCLHDIGAECPVGALGSRNDTTDITDPFD